MVIRETGNEVLEITIFPETRRFCMKGANDESRSRVKRLVSRQESLERVGIVVRHFTVPGIGYNVTKLTVQ